MTQNSRSDWRASQAITQRKRDLIPTITVDRAFLDRHNAIRSTFEMPHHPALEYKCDFLTKPRGLLRQFTMASAYPIPKTKTPVQLAGVFNPEKGSGAQCMYRPNRGSSSPIRVP